VSSRSLIWRSFLGFLANNLKFFQNFLCNNGKAYLFDKV
jgi:hypothetical protein